MLGCNKKLFWQVFFLAYIFAPRESIEYFVTKKKLTAQRIFLTIGRNDDAILLKDNMH